MTVSLDATVSLATSKILPLISIILQGHNSSQICVIESW